ncbi:MAG: hypothetical protein LBG82_00405 [Clostridiales Family XIII bacterium]|jgi:hypothetical protein|nr:hypothetical protein [Clostridiales Family XIII bacterium]
MNNNVINGNITGEELTMGTAGAERRVVGRKLPRRAQTPEPAARKAVTKYAFAGLSSRAGATTLALAFADWLARPSDRSVAYIGICDEGLRLSGNDYDKLGIDRRFAGRGYVSCYDRLAHGGSARAIENLDGGVNWLLRVPGEKTAPFDVADYVRLSACAASDVAVLDVCGQFGGQDRVAATQKLLRDCDRVFAVIDPLPSALMADPEKLEMFKAMESVGAEVLYVLNKMNSGVDVREMRAFLKIRDAVEVPFLDPAGIYAAEYNCCTVYAMPKLAQALDTAFTRMAT